MASRVYSAWVWDVSNGREVARLDLASDFVNKRKPTVADGRYLATGSEDMNARVWDVSSGREVARFPLGG